MPADADLPNSIHLRSVKAAVQVPVHPHIERTNERTERVRRGVSYRVATAAEHGQCGAVRCSRAGAVNAASFGGGWRSRYGATAIAGPRPERRQCRAWCGRGTAGRRCVSAEAGYDRVSGDLISGPRPASALRNGRFARGAPCVPLPCIMHVGMQCVRKCVHGPRGARQSRSETKTKPPRPSFLIKSQVTLALGAGAAALKEEEISRDQRGGRRAIRWPDHV